MPSTIYPFSDRGSTHPDRAVEQKTAIVSLTNAQIKALATAAGAGAIEIVPAPGAGKVIVAGAYMDGSGVVLQSHLAADYTNIDAAAAFRFSLGAITGPRVTLINDLVDALLDAGAPGDFIAVLSPGEHLDTASTQDAAAQSVYANKALILDLPNASAGALTGGNAANTMRVVVSYYVIEVA